MNARFDESRRLSNSGIMAELFENFAAYSEMPHTAGILDRLCRDAMSITATERAIVSLHNTENAASELFLFPQHMWACEQSTCSVRGAGLLNLSHADVAVIDDIVKALVSDETRDNVAALGINSGLCVPIRCRESVFGHICLFASEKRHIYPAEVVKTVEALAAQAGLALGYAMRFDAVAGIMARLQDERSESIASAAVRHSEDGRHGFERGIPERVAEPAAVYVSGRRKGDHAVDSGMAASHDELDRVQGLSMLYEITGIATALAHSKELAEQVVGYIIGKFGISMASIWLFDRERGVLVPKASKGFPDSFFEYLPFIPLEERFEAAQVYTGGEPAIVEDLDTADIPAGTRDVIEKIGLQEHAYILLPLKARMGTIGILSFSWPYARRFTDEDIRFYLSIANQVAIGLENARLHEETERELEMMKALNRVSSLVSSTLSLDELSESVLGPIKDYFELEALGIHIVDEGAGTLKHASSLYGACGERDCLQKTVTLGSDSLMALAAGERRMVEFGTGDEVPKSDACDAACSLGAPVRRFYVPIVTRDRVGAVLGGCCRHGTVPTEIARQTMEAIAGQVAIGIEMTRRYETEKRIADTLQAALLDTPDKIRGLRFSSCYRSATEAVRVGGDFYDIFELEHNKVGIVLGDVSGKGLEAATLTSLVKNTVKAYAFEGHSPAVVLTKTNRLVCRMSPDTRFVTVFYGVLDTASGELTYCNGGHVPGLVRRESGVVDMLEPTSPIIGAFEEMSYTDVAVLIRPEDALVLYTDGVVEPGRKGVVFDEGELVRCVADAHAVGVEDMPGLIYGRLDAVVGDVLLDDVIILAVALGEAG